MKKDASPSATGHQSLINRLEELSNEGPMLHCRSWVEIQDTLRAAAMALSVPSERKDMVLVPRSLAERTEAMFTSVDPFGGISKEWGEVMLSHHRQGKAV